MSVKRPVFPASVWDGTSEDRSSRVIDRESYPRDHDRLAAEIIAIEEYLLANPPSGQTAYSAEADSQLEIGTPIYLSANGHVNIAQAHNALTADVAGISNKEVLATFAAEYISEGKIVKSDWTAIIGTQHLAAGQDYYLDPDTPGRMTASAPTATGDFLVRLGKAQTETVFDVEIRPPIRL